MRIELAPRRALAVAIALGVLAVSAPHSSRASGTPSPPPMPPPSNPSTPPGSDQPTQSPEEKAAQERREAVDLYNDGYKEAEKAKAEMAEADVLAAAGDAKSAEKAKKKTESARKRLGKQVDKFMRATQLDPNYHEAWNMLGYSLRKTGDSKKAFEAYWECLRLKPDYVPAHEYLGEAYLEANNLEKAQGELTWLKDKDATLAAELEKKIQKYVEAHPQSTTTGAAAGSGN
jgi:tetratricopeptide (TPR) repeat protein